jgi:hypothetical protein
MRRGRRGLASIAAAISALVVAPGALAATPGEICRDLADGTLNETYSAGDVATYVEALSSDPTIQGYCTPFTPQPSPETPAPATPQETPAPPATQGGGVAAPAPPTTGGVLPAVSPTVTRTAGTLGATKTLGQTKASGTLPFTGTELTIFFIVGLALVGTGVLLRSTARQRSQPPA